MIEINNLTKKFGDKVLFSNFNLTIQSGEMVAIVGKSGCGKTTLLNMIGLIDLEYSGTIQCNKVKINNLNHNSKQYFIRENINYLFQNYALIDDQSVQENLELALYYTKLSKEDKKKVIAKSLAKVDLIGYEQKKVYTLSGGEQQRVALARSIIKSGNIILADEPTGNLDDENRDIVMHNLLEQKAQGKTIVIVTHDINLAKQCKRIIEL